MTTTTTINSTRRTKSWLSAGLLVCGLALSAGSVAHAVKKLSGAEVKRLATNIEAKGTDLAKTIEKMIAEAEGAKELDRGKCLKEKLPQVNTNVKMAGEYVNTINAQTPQGDVDQASTVLSVIAQKLQTLSQEANACVGKNAIESGSTKIEIEFDLEKLSKDESSGSAVVVLPPTVAGGGSKSPGVATVVSGKK
jgi:hypothetical protein